MTTIRMRTNSRRGASLRRAYLDWLCRQVARRGQGCKFDEFISDLHRVTFYSLIANDDNRIADGIALREKFIEQEDIDDVDVDMLFGPCTVLEMLIALADRMDFNLYDPSRGEKCEKWFWLFVENLGLHEYSSDDPNKNRKKRKNRRIINAFLERDYESNGEGGLFPLSNPRKDQRDEEIWYQMMNFINENYSI